MNKFFILYFIVSTSLVMAEDCCKFAGGQSKCEPSTGRVVCFNGEYSESCKCPVYKNSNLQSQVPNSKKEGKYWRCKSGYQFDNGKCEEIEVPQNAKLNSFTGGWECLPGHVRKNKKCQKLEIPENAHIQSDGKSWKCNSGYGQWRDICKKLNIPKNAKLNSDGKTWKCNEGYIPYRAICKKVNK